MAGLIITRIHTWACLGGRTESTTRDSCNLAVRVYLLCTCTYPVPKFKFRQTLPELLVSHRQHSNAILSKFVRRYQIPSLPVSHR